MGKKILRGLGYFLTVVMLAACVGLIAVAVMFGAEGAVKLFGYNVFIADTDEFDGVAKGSAVIASDIGAYDIEPGNLLLFRYDGEAVLGYAKDISLSDGKYVITAFDSHGDYSFTDDELIGKAEMSSLFWGNIIAFIKTPWGIAVMALLPCIALILFDIARAAAAKLPPPEVEPQLKSDSRPAQVSGLSVKEDGNAQFSRSGQTSQPSAASDVLFSYAGKQAEKKPDIIPLTERKSSAPAPKSADTPVSGTPASVAARRYLDSAKASADVRPDRKIGDTAEIRDIPKKSRNDAFFAQSDVPQIGRQKPSKNRSVIDLEDTLASIGSRSEKQPTAKRSSEILASRGTAELKLDEADDEKSSYDIDEIIAGLGRKK